MQAPGPQLETLLRRLSECPPEFLEACHGPNGAQIIAAILCDHFRVVQSLDNSRFVSYLRSSNNPTAGDQRTWELLSIAAWLLHDEWFKARPELFTAAWEWLQSDQLPTMAQVLNPEKCITDPDRREELARHCLSALGLHPAGETIEQAHDRQMTLDSVERQRIVSATAAAERRAREVRQAMALKAAQESASRYGE